MLYELTRFSYGSSVLVSFYSYLTSFILQHLNIITVYCNLINELNSKKYGFNHDNLLFFLVIAPLAVCKKRQEAITHSNINVFIMYVLVDDFLSIQCVYCNGFAINSSVFIMASDVTAMWSNNQSNVGI